jgi:predicted RNA-binding protein with PUA-like domain
MTKYILSMTSKNYYLLKSEPETYPIDQLKAEKRTAWTGVRNYQARNFMKAMHAGDLCIFYHSGKAKECVGVARVVGEPYPDPTQFDEKSYSYDPKATQEKPIWMLVDIEFVQKFKRPISLREVKRDPGLRGMVLAQATRLSVQPVSEKHFEYMLELASEK